MRWQKKGVIYSPPMDGSWKDNSALTPTAFLMNDDVIRVYSSFRDSVGVGRIGFVDVDARDPSKILNISEKPVLDIGLPGMFDDNGVILGDIIRVDDKVYMYYVGFQLVKKAKFLAYSGLAISRDGGNVFTRHSQAPILDRADEGTYIRAIHSVIQENGIFKIWYAVGNGWERIDDVDYPQYDINYQESDNGIDFKKVGKKVVENNRDNKEYRVGRPRVYKKQDEYIMNFTFGTVDGRYQTGQASSSDGESWMRDDELFGLKPSGNGWDSKHLSYPSIITLPNEKMYAFYNGNNMGAEGFGYAEMVVN